jgi:hypothetical protein
MGQFNLKSFYCWVGTSSAEERGAAEARPGVLSTLTRTLCVSFIKARLGPAQRRPLRSAHSACGQCPPMCCRWRGSLFFPAKSMCSCQSSSEPFPGTRFSGDDPSLLDPLCRAAGQETLPVEMRLSFGKKCQKQWTQAEGHPLLHHVLI